MMWARFRHAELSRYDRDMIFRVVAIISLLLMPFVSSAVLPPDLLFSVGSSFAQWLSVLAAVFAGIVASTLPFARSAAEGFRASRGKILLALGVGCAVALVIALVALPEQTSPPPIILATSTPSGIVSREFFADDIVLVAPESPFGRFAVDLSLNRKQEPDGTFVHYYYADLLLGTTTFGRYDSAQLPHAALAPVGAVAEIVRDRSADLSARATIAGTLQFGPHTVMFATDELNGDFLIKDLPEYMKHGSAGRVRLEVDGTEFDGFVYAAHISSTDFAPTIFFPGYNTMHANARQFMFWDAEGNFFLADRTDVREEIPAYPSHQWTLFRSSDGMARKGSSITVSGNMDDPERGEWRLEGSDAFDPDFRFTTFARYVAQSASWYIEGVGETVGAPIPVMGVAHIERIVPQGGE